MNSKNQSVRKLIPFATHDILEIIFHDRMRSAALQAAALHHEFHIPLTIIKGLAEYLLRNPEHSPEENLQKIVNESGRLLQNLDAMNFTLSKESLQIQKVSLRQIVLQVISFFEKLCLERSIFIQVDISDKIMVETDPYRFKSIIGAVFQNSIESFLNENHRGTKNISLYAEENQKKTYLTISDSGTGMSEEMQNSIRQNILTGFNETDLGNGLGLALACNIARGLDVEFNFFSEKFRGTSVTLAFKK